MNVIGVNHACKIYLKGWVKGAAVDGPWHGSDKNNKTHTNPGTEPFSESWQVLPDYGVPIEGLEEPNQEQVTSVNISISRHKHIYCLLAFPPFGNRLYPLMCLHSMCSFFLFDSNKE